MLGSRNVYFQPPETIKLHYPCIVYSAGEDLGRYADNLHYLKADCYDVQIIAKDPTFELFETFTSKWQYAREKVPFTAENLNHHNYTVYF
jgi:hypothetical protein